MGKRKNRKAPSPPRTFDGPAKQGEGQVHVIEKFNEGSTGQSKRFRNIGNHPLTMAFHRGQISEAHNAAGKSYIELWSRAMPHGLDSTQALDRSGGSGGVEGVTVAQINAYKKLTDVEGFMSRVNRKIIRYFCGEGRSMKEAVERCTGVHPNGIKYRLQEALEDLEDALDKARIRRAA